MERNRNWQGWVAIALASLALIVALSGRSPWGNQQSNEMMWSAGTMGAQQGGPSFGNVPQAAQAAPQAAHVPAWGRDQRGQRGQDNQRGQRFMPGQGVPHGMMGQGMMGQGMMGRQSHCSIFGIVAMFFGLAKLIALGLLAWLLLRTFMQRRSAPPAAPTPTTPAGHDPTIE